MNASGYGFGQIPLPPTQSFRDSGLASYPASNFTREKFAGDVTCNTQSSTATYPNSATNISTSSSDQWANNSPWYNQGWQHTDNTSWQQTSNFQQSNDFGFQQNNFECNESLRNQSWGLNSKQYNNQGNLCATSQSWKNRGSQSLMPSRRGSRGFSSNANFSGNHQRGGSREPGSFTSADVAPIWGAQDVNQRGRGSYINAYKRPNSSFDQYAHGSGNVYKKPRTRPLPPSVPDDASDEEHRDCIVKKLYFVREYLPDLSGKCIDKADYAQKGMQLGNILLEQKDVRVANTAYALMCYNDIILFIGRGANKKSARKDAMEMAQRLLVCDAEFQNHKEFNLVQTSVDGEWMLDIPRNQDYYTAMKIQQQEPFVASTDDSKLDAETDTLAHTMLKDSAAKYMPTLGRLHSACARFTQTSGSPMERCQRAFTEAKLQMLRLTYDVISRGKVLCNIDYQHIWLCTGRGKNKAEARVNAYNLVEEVLSKPVTYLTVIETNGVPRFWHGDEASLISHLAELENYRDAPEESQVPQVKTNAKQKKVQGLHSGRATFEITRDFASKYQSNPDDSLRILLVDRAVVSKMSDFVRLLDIAQINRLEINTPTEELSNNEGYLCKIILGARFICEGNGDSPRQARLAASKTALDILKQTSPTIVVKRLYSTEEKVTKDNTTDTNATKEDTALPDANKGHRLLTMMGWTGGSLGVQKEGRDAGIIEPISLRGQTCTTGMGYVDLSQQFKSKINALLEEFVHTSDVFDDLLFSAEFTKEEREYIHKRARIMHLKSRSRNQEEGRVLCVGHYIDWWQIYELLMTNPDHCGGKYELIQPPM